MHPILLHLGDFPVHTYGALGALAFLVGASLMLVRARALGLDGNRVADVIFGTAIASLAGARLLYVALEPGSVTSLADLAHVRGGGLVFYGAFVLGVPVAALLARWRDLPALPLWDLFGTAFPFAHALGRLGCFAAGCCHGRPTRLPWAVTFPDGNPLVPAGVALHPTQLYEALGLVGVGVLTNLAWRRRRFEGEVLLLYVALYAALRIGVEAFRGDERGTFVAGVPISFSQGVSLLLGLAAVGLWVREARRAAVRRAIGQTIRGPRAG